VADVEARNSDIARGTGMLRRSLAAVAVPAMLGFGLARSQIGAVS
jgi:hypothetical protein